ncbi:ABC transporter permease [Paraclostridium sordellii]
MKILYIKDGFKTITLTTINICGKKIFIAVEPVGDNEHKIIDVLKYNSVTRSFKSYLGYFLSSTIAIMIFWGFSVCVYHPVITGAGIAKNSAAYYALSTTDVIIAMFSLLFIIYSLGTFIKSIYKEFGTLMIIGMSDKQFKKLIFLEVIIIGILSIISGIIIGLVVSKPFLILMSKALEINASTMYIPTNAIVLTIVVFLILFSIASPLTIIFIKNKSILDLLNESKKPKEEPKTSIILSIISIVMLVIGYFTALFGGIPSVILVCIVVGTFLFFSQFSVLILKLLKKNIKLYMNKTNVLWISNLVYKIKDNSRLLFIMTILLSGTLVATSALSSIVANQLEDIKANYPFVINYIIKEDNKNKNEQLSLIENTLKENKYNYNKTIYNVLEINDSNDYVIKNSEYNKIAGKLGLDKVSLDKNQAVLVPRFNDTQYRNKLKDTSMFTALNNKLKVVGVSKDKIFPLGYGQNIAVVNDSLYSDLAKDSSSINTNVYGYDYKNWENSGDIISKLQEKIQKNSLNDYDKDKYYEIFSSLPDMYKVEVNINQVLLFMGTFIAIIFFIGSCSFLYFRFYTDLILDKEKYKNLSKIGLSLNEIKRVLNIEIGSMFFIPYFIAFLNAIFSVIAISTMKGTYLGLKGIIVSFVFFLIYFVYFLFLKTKYIKEIATNLN